MKTSTPTPGSCRALLIAHLKSVSEDTLSGCTKALKPLSAGTVKSTLSKNRGDFRPELRAGLWFWALARKTPAKPSRSPKARRTKANTPAR